MADRRILLFDIDGTLIAAGGAGRRSMELALGDHLAPRLGPRATWLDGLRLDGLTDRLIIRLAVEGVGQPFDDRECDAILAAYLRHLDREIAHPAFRVLPGVAPLLAELRERRAPLGLCTGNLAEGARIKLRRGGLDGFFGYGEGDLTGFAEDGEERSLLVRAALRRASARLGREVRPAEALVIGDTPRDVSAAHAVGVPVLAVATGRFGVEELQAAGADQVAPSLEDPAARALLLGEAARA